MVIVFYYVYIIENVSGEIYIGATSDLQNRLAEHNSGRVDSTKGCTWKLAYYEAFRNKRDAFEREKKLKHHGYGIGHLRDRIERSLEDTV